MSIGIVLSGGGVRGAGHLGVLKALEENDIKPDYISGTSAGSIVASLYSVGFNIEEIKELLKGNSRVTIFDFNISELFSYVKSLMLNLNKQVDGFIRGERIKKILSDCFKEKNCSIIRETKIPLAIPAVDINTSKTIIFLSDKKGLFNNEDIEYYDDAPIETAVRASISYPVVFKPVIFNGNRLVDGGVKDNLPITILKQLGADKVLAVNLGYTGKAKSEIDNVLEIVAQAIDIMSYQISKVKFKEANYVLLPEIYDVKLFEFGRIQECIDRGYNAAINKMPEIKKALGIGSIL